MPFTARLCEFPGLAPLSGSGRQPSTTQRAFPNNRKPSDSPLSPKAVYGGESAQQLKPARFFQKTVSARFFRTVNPERFSAFGAFSWGKCAVFCVNRRWKGQKHKYCHIFSLSPIFFYAIMTAGCADFCTLSMFVRRHRGRNQHIHFRRVTNLCL